MEILVAIIIVQFLMLWLALFAHAERIRKTEWHVNSLEERKLDKEYWGDEDAADPHDDWYHSRGV